MPHYVYILASRRNGTLYTGSTTDIERRIGEHRSGAGSHFTAQYKVFRLVYVEAHDDWEDAHRREHRIKRWRRQWKLNLIEATNPDWRDLMGLEQADD